MRALAVIHNPLYGGAHNELLGQREGLAAAGWELLALTGERGSGRDRLLAAGLPVLETPLHRLRASADPRLHAALAARFAPEVRALRRVIRAQRIDLVQPHGVLHPHAAVAAHLEGVAVCWHLYDMVAPAPLRRALMPLVLRLADSVTTIGHALARAHPGTERLGERLVVTSPPVDLGRFRPDTARRAAARRELGLADADLAVGTVANLFPNKGHTTLVEAFGRLAARHGAARLRILGGASAAHARYAQALHGAIADAGLGERARVLDPGTRVDALLGGLDVFVMPSRSEGMPTTVLEAMGCALPVVASDVGAVGEAVEHGRTGVLVAPGDAGALAAALEPLLSDAALRARMGAAGRARALERFDLPRVVERRLLAYELALEHRRARS